MVLCSSMLNLLYKYALIVLIVDGILEAGEGIPLYALYGYSRRSFSRESPIHTSQLSDASVMSWRLYDYCGPKSRLAWIVGFIRPLNHVPNFSSENKSENLHDYPLGPTKNNLNGSKRVSASTRCFHILWRHFQNGRRLESHVIAHIHITLEYNINVHIRDRSLFMGGGRGAEILVCEPCQK